MNNKVTIEICCGSVEDAIIAEKAGADRIELNSSISLGGITPSIGSLIETKRNLNIPVMVMIRPRESGFFYDKYEIKSMEEDIKLAIKYGADGIVFGVLNEDGTINKEALKRFVDIIGDKEKVFHRAFDIVKNPIESLDTLIELGVDRVLTKGQKNSIEDGYKTIKEIIKYSKGKIEILTGGVRPHNVEWMIRELNFRNLHVASFIQKEDLSMSSNPDVYFGSSKDKSECSYSVANYEYLKEMCRKIRNLQEE